MKDRFGKVSRRTLLKTGAAASAALLTPSSPAEGPVAWPMAEPWTQRVQQAAAPADASSPRARYLMDQSWKFAHGNSAIATKDFNYGIGVKTEPFGKTGYFADPCELNFDDSGWAPVSLPHDWAVELPFVNDPTLVRNGFKAIGRNYPDGSIGWYRRKFRIPAAGQGGRILLEFDGVFRDCVVVLNGCFLGRNLSGYAPFHFDITDLAKPDSENILTLRVDASVQEGWFYEGAGIYRHVWLSTHQPLHLGFHETYLRTEQRGDDAALFVQAVARNAIDQALDCTIHVRIRDANGKEVASGSSRPQKLKAQSEEEVAFQMPISRPSLWSPEEPYRYSAEVYLERGGEVVDKDVIQFGVRYTAFDAQRGFLLNGKPYKLKGTCDHQDHAGVGTAVPDSVQEYRVRRLKAMGSNAIRTSHNPASRSLIEVCDRVGMCVMEETRMFSSCEEGLSQLKRIVKRDRNSPCIVIWSIGNEEMHTQGNATGVRIATAMKRLCKQLDPSRAVTAAMNGGWGAQGESPVLDVMGCNYHTTDIDKYHSDFPNQPMIGTETASTTGTRGIYQTDVQDGYVSSYDLVNGPAWADTAERWWKFYDERPFLAGGFCWTGFDYRGEPTPYAWPCISSHFGVIDTCGFPKDNFFYYRSWWQNEPVVHLLPHWNWEHKQGENIAVWCYTNLQEVELFLNGKSLGSKRVEKNGHLEWQVPFERGTLEAQGKRDGKVILTDKRVTSQAPTHLKAASDRKEIRADGDDAAMVEVALVDDYGTVVPWGSAVIEFTISGPGVLIGVGNGDPSCHESDKGHQRSAFSGLCMAIVQSTLEPGEIVVSARSGGLGASQVRVSAVTSAPRPLLPL